jgi:hypothetical protein
MHEKYEKHRDECPKACENMLTINYTDKIKTIPRYSFTTILLAKTFKYDNVNARKM